MARNGTAAVRVACFWFIARMQSSQSAPCTERVIVTTFEVNESASPLAKFQGCLGVTSRGKRDLPHRASAKGRWGNTSCGFKPQSVPNSAADFSLERQSDDMMVKFRNRFSFRDTNMQLLSLAAS